MMEEKSKTLPFYLGNQREKLEKIAEAWDTSLAGALRRLIQEFKLEEGDRNG